MAHPQTNTLAGHTSSHTHESSQKESQSSVLNPETDFPLNEVTSHLYWHLFDWFDLDRSIRVTVDSASSLPEFLLAYGRMPPGGSEEISTELYPLKTAAINDTSFQNILLIQDYYLVGLVHKQGGEFRFFDTKVSGDEWVKSQHRLQLETKALLAAKPPINVNEKEVAKGILSALGVSMEDTKPLSPVGFDITPVTPFLFVPTAELRANSKTPTTEKAHKQVDSLYVPQQSNMSLPKPAEKPSPSHGQPALLQNKPRSLTPDPSVVEAATPVQSYMQSKASSSKLLEPSSNINSSLLHMKPRHPTTVAMSQSQRPKVSSPKLVEQSGHSHDQLAPPHKKPRVSTTAPVATSDRPRLRSKVSLPKPIWPSDNQSALLHTKLHPSTIALTSRPRATGLSREKRKNRAKVEVPKV